jgi:hypothetical protein
MLFIKSLYVAAKSLHVAYCLTSDDKQFCLHTEARRFSNNIGFTSISNFPNDFYYFNKLMVNARCVFINWMSHKLEIDSVDTLLLCS